MLAIDPDELLLAYRLGVFPMAEHRESSGVLWIRPRERCILPLDDFHVPKRLARTVRSDHFEVRTDSVFGEVIRACAGSSPQRGETWINQAIIDVFETLHARGAAHSIETFEDGRLVGGLYGLSIGAAFFGESMFSLRADASKVALVHLAARLKAGNYALLDAQFPNPHLGQFGALTVSEREFERLLEDALPRQADFYSLGGASGPGATKLPSGPKTTGSGGGSSVLQVITQTS